MVRRQAQAVAADPASRRLRHARAHMGLTWAYLVGGGVRGADHDGGQLTGAPEEYGQVPSRTTWPSPSGRATPMGATVDAARKSPSAPKIAGR
ncbi:hypothetical protein [Streptomyces sp. NL15-2K]|uniref:hypothetical protein n=1 Tax=Streptomyces sp. NL15-2K TaxID=376149 RepID=UPI000F581160|nr:MULTISPECIES: hypothetical protein [Actinomycetes]WKX15219.1 hypothetical protein Q4V64_50080 [Kutzneria buriramensis]GCB52335.1 hypothetical protein SNL152K_9691 [Streptomyces sp. NL15-2K]